MTELLNEKLLAWIAKNRLTFLLVILLIGNVYQYVDRRELQNRHDQYIKEQNQYWKERAEKMEFLFNSLLNVKKEQK